MRLYTQNIFVSEQRETFVNTQVCLSTADELLKCGVSQNSRVVYASHYYYTSISITRTCSLCFLFLCSRKIIFFWHSVVETLGFLKTTFLHIVLVIIMKDEKR